MTSSFQPGDRAFCIHDRLPPGLRVVEGELERDRLYYVDRVVGEHLYLRGVSVVLDGVHEVPLIESRFRRVRVDRKPSLWSRIKSLWN